MSVRRMDAVSVGVLGLTAALTAAVYERLPLRMGTPFDLEGNANGWMSREMGAWFVPVGGLALWAVLRFVPRVLPVGERKRLGASSAALVALLTTVFLAAVHMLILYVA